MSAAATLDTYCTTLLDQTERLTTHTREANLTHPVPTCPTWTLAHLLRHVADAYTWAERIVRTRAHAPDHLVDEPDAPAPRLTESAARLVATLRDAGPDAQVWSPAPPHTPLFWARRMAVESMVHRYDAAHAVGVPYELAPDVARIGLEEWTFMGTLVQAFPSEGHRRRLLGPGRTVHLHATDAAGEWLIDLTGEDGGDILVRRAHEKAAVAVRAPAADLLLLMYGRRALTDDGIEVFGDGELFERWRELSGDWSRRK